VAGRRGVSPRRDARQVCERGELFVRVKRDGSAGRLALPPAAQRCLVCQQLTRGGDDLLLFDRGFAAGDEEARD